MSNQGTTDKATSEAAARTLQLEARRRGRDWLVALTNGYDVFGTLTFKTCLPYEAPRAAALGPTISVQAKDQARLAAEAKLFVWLTEDDARAALKHWTRAVNRAVFGNNARRKRCEFERVVCIEGGDGIKRLHAHFLAKTPAGWQQDDFIQVLHKTWWRVRWAAPRDDMEAARSQVAVMTYLQKGGLDRVELGLSSLSN